MPRKPRPAEVAGRPVKSVGRFACAGAEATLRPAPLDWAAWGTGAALLLGGCLGLTWLSPRFGAGEIVVARPILLAAAWQALMGLGFLLAVAAVAFRRRAMPLWFLLTVALLARLVLAPSNLIQATDCYRYVLDGSTLGHGINPFRHTPLRIEREAREDFRRVLASPPARAILVQVNHPELPTIYPPLAQLSFAAGAALTPWDWHGQRWVFMGFDLATLILLLWGLKRLDRPLGWVLLYAWNPIVLKDITNSVHLDSLPGLLVLGLCLALALHAAVPDWRIALVAAGLFAAAVLAKVYPVILAPVCLAVLARRRAGQGSMARLAIFCAAVTFLLVVGAAPFVSVGWGRFTESFSAFTLGWERNNGAYALLRQLFPFPRAFALLIPLLVGGVAAWRVLKAPPAAVAETVIAAFQAVLLAWFLFLPIAYPWYALSLLAVSALRPRPWAYALSVSFILYYLPCLNVDLAYRPGWGVAARAIEHGAVWGALLVGVWAARRRPHGTPSQSPSSPAERLN